MQVFLLVEIFVCRTFQSLKETDTLKITLDNYL